MKISKIISQIMKVSVVVYRMTDSSPEKESRHTGFSGDRVRLFPYFTYLQVSHGGRRSADTEKKPMKTT